MPGCAAQYCTNSSVKGFKMLHFPRDSRKRAQWVANVNRPNWISTENSTLCEVHFAEDMWEKVRVDGKRKLKPNSIPTIFSNEPTKKTRKRKVATKKLTVCKVKEIELNSCKNNIASTEMQADATSVIGNVDDVNLKVGETDSNADATSVIGNVDDMNLKVGETDSDGTSSENTIGHDEKDQILTDSETVNVEEDDRYKKLEKLWLKSERLRKRMKNKLRAARTEIKRLRSINVRRDPC